MQSTAALTLFQQMTKCERKRDNERLMAAHTELRSLLTWTKHNGLQEHPLLGQPSHGICMMSAPSESISVPIVNQFSGKGQEEQLSARLVLSISVQMTC